MLRATVRTTDKKHRKTAIPGKEQKENKKWHGGQFAPLV
jgi:hypothetical protein